MKNERGRLMKRVLCASLALCLIPFCALGVTDVETMVYGHNIYVAMTGAAELTGVPEQKTTSKGQTIYTYTVNGVDVGFIVKDGMVSSVYCRASEEHTGEMLAQSAAALYNVCGTNNIDYWYFALLDQYLSARSGETTETKPFIKDVCIFEIYKDAQGAYVFLASVL